MSAAAGSALGASGSANTVAVEGVEQASERQHNSVLAVSRIAYLYVRVVLPGVG
jgi:hypothetical protein